MNTIVLLASAWGAAYGGINSLNEDLCSALGRAAVDHPDLSVVCVALSASNDEILVAHERGVRLIGLRDTAPGDRFDESMPYELARLSQEWGNVSWWIGHDAISGPAAVATAALTDSRAAVIQHTDYAAYAPLTGTPGAKVGRRQAQDVRVLSGADVVFGVGPKLTDAARDRLLTTSGSSIVRELVPGLADIEFLPQAPIALHALTFGRLDPKADRIKQGTLAVHSFATLVNQLHDAIGDDPRMTVVDVDEQSDPQALTKLATDYAGRSLPVISMPYTAARDELYDHVRRASVCLMLSLHEGFGLVGWEAIAAAVPLVITRNSGLYSLLKRRGGKYTGCVWAVDVKGQADAPFYRSSDVDDVTKALREIALDGRAAKAKAIELRELLRSETWQRTAAQLLAGLGIETDNPHDVTADSEKAVSILPPSNLPSLSDSFVGHGSELEDGRQLMARRVRLITVVGPPGAGKTRVALQLATTALARFENRVFFVDLEALGDPNLVLTTITRALRLDANEPLLEVLSEVFRDRPALLVLDNFDGVVSAATSIVTLLRSIPELSVLITSREPLQVPVEERLEVHPLDLESAVQLFIARSPRPDRTFESDDGNLRSLCQDLQGLPLAIELVAAWSRVYSVSQLQNMLGDHLLYFETPRRGTPDRHVSLSNAIEWSFRRLGPKERELMMRLSVFRGGFTLDFAATVAGYRSPFDLEFGAAVSSLLERRLIREVPDVPGRFEMLGVIGQYAGQQLKREVADGKTRDIHAHMFLDFATQRPDELDVLEAERQNISAALSRLVETDDMAEALRLAASMGEYWWSRDYSGGLDQLELLLDRSVPQHLIEARARVLLVGARLAVRQGGATDLGAWLDEVVRISGAISGRDGELLGAQALAQRGTVALERGELGTAGRDLAAARDLFESVGDRRGLADTLDDLATLAMEEGRLDDARATYMRSRQTYAEVSDASRYIAWVDNDLARLSLVSGDVAEAARRATDAKEVGESIGDPGVVSWAQMYLGHVACRTGNLDEAIELHRVALKRLRLVGDLRPMALALEAVAAVRSAGGSHATALVLLGGADAIRARAGTPRMQFELMLLSEQFAKSEDAIEDGARAELLERGRRMSLDEMIVLALSD